MKFAFVGGTVRAYKLLEKFFENSYQPEIAYILREDDHEAEKYSGKISELLKSQGIPFHIKKKLSNDDVEILKRLKLDVIIVYGWRTIISTELNSHLKFGMIAAHQALLPKYRGFAPVQWAIINGEKYCGTSLFRIEDGEIDSGPVIYQKKRKIKADDHWYDIDNKLIDDTIRMFLNFFRKKGKVKFVKQDPSKATYTCKRIPEDGRIDWNDPSKKIFDLIRGTAPPLPGAFCFYNDRKFIIHEAQTGGDNKKKFIGRIPGRIIRTGDEGIEVLCGKGTLHISKWEDPESGTITSPGKTIKSITSTLK